MDVAIISLIVSAVSVSFAIFFGLKNNKRTDTKDIEERVKENTRINFKLDTIMESTKEIKVEMSNLKEEMQMHNDRIIKVEESARQGHKRIDALEGRFNEFVNKFMGGGNHE